MPWAKFLEPFDFSPADKGGRVTVAYPAGFVANVTRECFDQAKAAGKAVKAAAPHPSPGAASGPSGRAAPSSPTRGEEDHGG